MVESVGNLGGTGGLIRSAPARGNASSPSAPQEASNGTLPPLSPRVTSDPIAGIMVMEYLGSDGQTSLQFPSTRVVEYLRSGLTQNGMPIHDAVSSVEKEV